MISEPINPKDVRTITDFLRQMANEIDQRGVIAIRANNSIEQIEINNGSAMKEYRIGPHMSFTLEVDWRDIPPEGGDDRDVRRVM